jgi:hypothetical protein
LVFESYFQVDVRRFSASHLEAAQPRYGKGAGQVMIKIGLYSEDRTLHTLLSSALGKEFEVQLEADEDGINLRRRRLRCCDSRFEFES